MIITYKQKMTFTDLIEFIKLIINTITDTIIPFLVSVTCGAMFGFFITLYFLNLIDSFIKYLFRSNSSTKNQDNMNLESLKTEVNSNEVQLTPEGLINVFIEHIEKCEPKSTDRPINHYLYYLIKFKNKILQYVLERDEKIVNLISNKTADYKIDYTFNQEIMEKYLDGTIVVPREAIRIWLKDPQFCLMFVKALLEEVIKANPDDYMTFLKYTKLFFDEDTLTRGYSELSSDIFLSQTAWFVSTYLQLMDDSANLTFNGLSSMM